MSFARQSTGVALVTALLVSLGAQCLIADEATATRMPCCASAEHDCHSPAVAQACCEIEPLDEAQVVPPYVQPLAAPVILHPSSTIPALTSSATTPRGIVIDATDIKGASPPTYVLLNTFLI